MSAGQGSQGRAGQEGLGKLRAGCPVLRLSEPDTPSLWLMQCGLLGWGRAMWAVPTCSLPAASFHAGSPGMPEAAEAGDGGSWGEQGSFRRSQRASQLSEILKLFKEGLIPTEKCETAVRQINH